MLKVESVQFIGLFVRPRDKSLVQKSLAARFVCGIFVKSAYSFGDGIRDHGYPVVTVHPVVVSRNLRECRNPAVFGKRRIGDY